MKTLSRFLFGLAVLGLAETVRADFRADPPKPPVKKDDGSVPLVVQFDVKAPQAKLEIPRKLLGQAKAGLGIEPPAVANSSRLPTIMAGLSLTLAFVCGGLWLARHRGQFGGRGLALLAGAGTLLAVGGASLVWADVPVRPIARPVPLPAPVAPVFGDVRVIVEVVEKGDVIKLTLNRMPNFVPVNGPGQPIPLPPGAVPVPPIGVAPAIPPVAPPVPPPAIPSKGVGIPAPPPVPAPQTPKPLEKE